MTELDDDCAALVADPEDGLHVYLPSDTEDTTGMFAFLCACAVRAHEDPDWVQSMIDWWLMQRQHPN